jgi:hypothetical protein
METISLPCPRLFKERENTRTPTETHKRSLSKFRVNLKF